MIGIVRRTRLALFVAFAAGLCLSGCMSFQTRSEAGRVAGTRAVDLSVGVLPVSGSFNSDQNMYPGFARMLDEGGFFSAIEPVASAGGKKFDLLLQAGPAGFAPEVKVMSGYSGKVLWQGKVSGLYGTLGRRFSRTLARTFAVGTPAYQGVVSEREVFRGRAPAPEVPAASLATAEAAPPRSDVDAPSYQMPQNPDDFAVVAGVEEYPGLPRAEFAERDARAVYSHLLALGYPRRNIALLTGGRAGREELAKAVETWLPSSVNEESSVFFYFSGHGAPKPETGEAFLLPAEGDPRRLEDTAYPLKRLYEQLNILPAKRAVVVLDAGFSGAGGRSVMAKGAAPLAAKVDTGDLSVGRLYALTASGDGETSGRMEEQGHGLFTYYFLKGLNGAAKDGAGRVTLRGVYEYLKPLVEGRRPSGESGAGPGLARSAGSVATHEIEPLLLV